MSDTALLKALANHYANQPERKAGDNVPTTMDAAIRAHYEIPNTPTGETHE